MIRVFHLNAGDCGACAADVWAAIEGASELEAVVTPQEADVIVLTGSIPAAVRAATLATITRLVQGRRPLVIAGRCAIDGYPFGRGGVAALPDVEVRRKVDGCPPPADLVVEALVGAARKPRLVES
jgi:Ni,Fe-hydrogenase III small subunit